MTYEYTVTDSHMVTPTTLVVTLYTKHPQRFMPYKPGQYAAISFVFKGEPTPVRCFSVISSPLDPGWLQFAMRVEGDFTQAAAHKLKVGDTAQVKGPFGGFVMNPYRDRMTVLLAGGIGVTPFMSMIRTAAVGQPTSEILLIYSCRSQDDVPFADELMALGSSNPYIHIVFVISNGPANRFAGWPVFQSRINGAMLDTMLGGMYAGKTFFLCGPPPFMDSLTKALVIGKVPKKMIVTEIFSQKVPHSSIFLGSPLQIYALTALGLVAGTGMVFNQDLQAANAQAISRLPAVGSGLDSTGNSRQSDVDNAINGLLYSGNNSDTPPGSAAPATNTGQDNGTPPANLTAPVPASNVPTSSSNTSTQPFGSAQSSSQTSSSTGASSTPTPSASTKNTSPPSNTPTVSPSPTALPTSINPTTAPPPPPGVPPVAPAFRFSATATTINKGSGTTLSWGLTNSATMPITCTASGGWSGTMATTGTQGVTPVSTTTYNLVCANSAGSASRSVTITVVAPPPSPPAPPPSPPPAPTPPPPPPSSGGS